MALVESKTACVHFSYTGPKMQYVDVSASMPIPHVSISRTQNVDGSGSMQNLKMFS